MEKILFVFFLGLCSVFCTEDSYDYRNIFYLPGYDLKGIEREYREQERRVERPCPIYDLFCIRRYLARHSDCMIAEGPVPDPLYRTESTSYLPTFNITATQNELNNTGLTGSISAFSVNRKSKLTVLRIDYNNLGVRSNKVYFRYHRRAREPAVTSSNTAEAIFPSVSITVVFKGVDHLRLADSESSVALNVPGTIALGPELGVHPDPSVAPRFANLMAQPLTFQQEAFLTNAPYFAAAYIQFVLCDFGLKLN